MLTTLLPPSSGLATVAGYDIVTQPAEVRRHIGYVPRRKTRAGCSGEGQAVLCVQNSKKAPSFIDEKPTSENREGCRMTYAIIWAAGGRDTRTHP